MPVDSKTYAQIADDVYSDVAIGSSIQTDAGQFDVIAVLDDNSDSGYFGAIYYNATTGEIVVAHRGTEGSGSWEVKLQDYIADAQMALQEINEQEIFAYSLMQQALGLAATLGASVTVTGHSLGGALAQLSAAEYGVSGETFNAYGAAELAAAGASADVINHVRATDLVAAIGQHIGAVEIYATQADVDLTVGPQIYTLAEILQRHDFDETHGVEQFYDGSMDFPDAIARNAEHAAWFAYQRALLRHVALGLEGTIESLAQISDLLIPEAFDSVPIGTLNALVAILNDSYLSAESRAFLGTDGIDSRSGTDGVDYLHGGAAADLLSGGIGNDWLYGDNGNDTLRGGTGVDQLYGGIEDDYLDGGSGSDRLDGGTGNDRYDFWIADFEATPGSIDTIVDADGQGTIEINSVPLAIGERLSETTWLSLTGDFVITADLSQPSQTLKIKHIATGSTILVEAWANDTLGIQLGGDVPTESTTNLTTGQDIFGAIGTNPGDDAIAGLAGNDGLEGGAGADVLDGGDDADLIFGGSGDDTLLGGAGNDLIFDGSELTNQREWSTDDSEGQSEAQWAEQDILDRGASVVARGKSWYVYTADGSAATGNSTLDAGYVVSTPSGGADLDPNASPSGDDIIDGGAGSDRIWAGEGDDIVIGGLGDEKSEGQHNISALPAFHLCLVGRFTGRRRRQCSGRAFDLVSVRHVLARHLQARITRDKSEQRA